MQNNIESDFQKLIPYTFSFKSEKMESKKISYPLSSYFLLPFSNQIKSNKSFKQLHYIGRDVSICQRRVIRRVPVSSVSRDFTSPCLPLLKKLFCSFVLTKRGDFWVSWPPLWSSSGWCSREGLAEEIKRIFLLHNLQIVWLVKAKIHIKDLFHFFPTKALAVSAFQAFKNSRAHKE